MHNCTYDCSTIVGRLTKISGSNKTVVVKNKKCRKLKTNNKDGKYPILCSNDYVVVILLYCKITVVAITKPMTLVL